MRPILPNGRIVLAAAALLALAGCHKPAETPAAGEPLPTVRVTVTTVEPKTYTAMEEVTGTVQSKTRAALEAKVSARIEQMLAVVGQTVTQGQLLVQLDAREVQARLDQAEAVAEQSRQDRKRFEALFEGKAVTQQELDATLARARVAEAGVSEAKTTLGYTKVLAPFSGVVTRKAAEIGDVAAPGRLLLELEDPRTLRVESDFPETLIDRVHLGDALTVRVGTNVWQATVGEIAPAADPNSRTFRVKLDLPPGTGARLGQFGRVMVGVDKVTTLRIPARALVVRGQMELVFVVVQKKAQMRLVRSGKRFGDQLEILAGLEAGESLVLAPVETLRDGQPLEVAQ